MNADQLLAGYASRIEHKLGRGTTTTSQLRRYGDALFPRGFFRGVYPAGQGPEKVARRYFFVVNTSTGQPGEHWLAVAVQPGKPSLLFDSFGRTPSASWQPHLRGMVTTDPDENQSKSTAAS